MKHKGLYTSLEKWKKKTVLIVFLVGIFASSISVAVAANKETMTISSIQVGSFRKAEDAEKERYRLKSKEVDAFIRYESARGKGMWYRVYIGRFNTLLEAEKRGQELENHGTVSAFWAKPLGNTQDFRSLHIKEETKTTKNDQPVSVMNKSISSNSGKLDRSLKDSTGKIAKITPKKGEDNSNVKDPELENINKKVLKKNDNFYVGYGLVGAFLPLADDFQIIDTSGSATRIFQFSDKMLNWSVFAEYRLKEFLFLEGRFEKNIARGKNFWYIAAGPKYIFDLNEKISPYLTASIAYGNYHWDPMPGNFDGSFGFEVGGGVETVIERLKIGVEFLYRNIDFTYNIPAGGNISSNRRKIDFSGISLIGSVGIGF